MQVGHGDVELAVRSTVDVRVADAMLLGNAVTGNYGLAVVYGFEIVAVIADGHEKRVGRVAEEGEEICAHILLGEQTFCLAC